MPETIQTSPLQVVRAARWPSGKKSKAPMRIQEWYGLLSGSVRLSTTYGSVFFPSAAGLARRPLVSIAAVQREGPPLVRVERSSGAGEDFASSSKSGFDSAPPEARRILKVAGLSV